MKKKKIILKLISAENKPLNYNLLLQKLIGKLSQYILFYHFFLSLHLARFSALQNVIVPDSTSP